jgi:ATP-dependent DNA helicase RecG
MAAHNQAADVLQSPIQYVKGVGPRLAEHFAARDIHVVGDALFLLPRRYEDRRCVVTIRELVPGQRASFQAEVLDFGMRRTGAGRHLFEVLLGDGTGKMLARWFHFHAPSIERRFARGDRVRVAASVEVYRGVRQVIHPDIEKLGGEDEIVGQDFGTLIPVYPEIEGVYPKTLRRIMRRVVEQYASAVPDILPETICAHYGFPPLGEALRAVHFPPIDADLDAYNEGRSLAHRRVVYEEFFLLQLGLALRRELVRRAGSRPLPVSDDMLALARDLFGFELTGGQQKVLAELLADLTAPKPMNRLLQGDVGSGKTAVAVLLSVVAARAGTQTAFMAPTEILAEQHYRRIQAMLQRGRQPIKVVLLTSTIQGAARSQILKAVATGAVQVVIGTHALIEEGVRYQRLGLCVIDEQHRFGVMQRARLRAKGEQPHVLVMTATPIPRTLAMTIYGDLDLSVLEELPPGRTPVKTVVLKGAEVLKAYQQVRREVQAGGQAFLVYPLVEESDKVELRDATQMYKRLQSGTLAGLRLALLHGRMGGDEKDRVMRRFAAGEIDVLVATTVVEVGVDVPRATLMVVEHAERFGLSQLHQLRGRIGRGTKPGTCYLVAHRYPSEDARSRLKIMEKTNDGFLIAEEDLAIRGPGEFLGTRQSGLPSFLFGNLIRDAELLSEARADARALIERDSLLMQPENRLIRRALWQRWGDRLLLAEVA